LISLRSLGAQRRNPSIGRIDNQRSSLVGRSYGLKYGVVCSRDVAFGAALHARIAAWDSGSLPVEFRPFLICEEFLTRKLRRTLQWRLVWIGPNTLQIRFAPWSLRRWACRLTVHRHSCHSQESGHDNHNCYDADHTDDSISHLKPPYR